jgi:hypothetical protein
MHHAAYKYLPVTNPQIVTGKICIGSRLTQTPGECT